MPSPLQARFNAEIRPWQLDLLVLVVLLILSPLHGVPLRLSLPPDSIGYLTFAETSLPNSLLYLSGWGHVDNAVVFPPLYPLLIALVNTVHPDGIGNGVAISYAASLLLTFPAYFFVRRFAPVLIAAVSVLVAQFGFGQVLFDGPLTTEALFLFALVSSLFLAMHISMLPDPRWWHGFALGAVTASAFFARQIGLLAAAFLVAWFVFDALRYRAGGWRSRFRVPVFFISGWMLLVLPYWALLYNQTGESVLNQSFRTKNYVVKTADPVVLDHLKQLTSADDPANYTDVYAKRRLLRELLPDGTEMLSHVVPLQETSEPRALLSGTDLPSRVHQLARNLSRNLGHFGHEFGIPALILTLIAFASPLFVRSSASPSARSRLIVPGFVVTYLVILSALTGTIVRYITVLYPLAVMQVAVELGALHSWARGRGIKPLLSVAAIALTFALLLFAERPPQRYNKRTFTEYASVFERQPLARSEPTYALLPAFAYLAGGSFRTLPNDALEKVIQYARLTGVKWMLVPRQPELFVDVILYANAGWLASPEELTRRTGLLNYCCVVEEHLLFEILPAAEQSPQRGLLKF